jgi:hypothetical protein
MSPRVWGAVIGSVAGIGVTGFTGAVYGGLFGIEAGEAAAPPGWDGAVLGAQFFLLGFWVWGLLSGVGLGWALGVRIEDAWRRRRGPLK